MFSIIVVAFLPKFLTQFDDSIFFLQKNGIGTSESLQELTKVCNGTAEKAMVSNIAQAWMGNEDVWPRTNSSML